MAHRLKRRLKSIFAPVAVGLTFFGCASLGSTHGPGDVNTPESTADNVEWKALTHSHARPYLYGKQPVQTPEKGTVKAVQIETSMDDIRGLTLEASSSPYSILYRHGEAAADILNRTADGRAKKDIDVTFIEEPRKLSSWFYNASHPLTRSIFNTADVVTLSMSMPAQGDQKHVYSGGNVNTLAEIEDADDLAKRSRAILVLSAGNSGDDMFVDLERETASPFIRFDTKVKVGEAGRDENGPYIEAHSSRSSPSFVTTNPFFTGYKYPFIRDGELRSRMREMYNLVPEGKTKPAQDIFNERITKKTVAPAGKSTGLQACHPQFQSAKFRGKEILKAPPGVQKNNPDKVREAFTECLVDAAGYFRSQFRADRDGFISGINGTSFSAPYAGGQFAAMKEKYPNLNEYDLVGAALIAATPVDRVKRKFFTYLGPKETFETIFYRDNGRGLPFNNREAGFGYLDADSLETVSRILSRMISDGSAPSTRERRIRSDLTAYENPEKMAYELDITSDILALRTNLMIRFKGNSMDVPDKITLVNPAGVPVELSPTRMKGNEGFSLASTNGHFGNHSKGTWKLVVPEGVSVESARLDIVGVEKGGALDQYLDRHGDDVPSPAPDPVSQSEEKRVYARAVPKP